MCPVYLITRTSAHAPCSHSPWLLCVSPQIHEAFYCIKPRVLLTIVASFGIGKSLGFSGLASWIAGGLVSFTLPLGTCLPTALAGASPLAPPSVACPGLFV